MRIEAKKVNNRSWYQRTVKVRESKGERQRDSKQEREREWQRERRTRTTHEKRERARESARLPVFQNNTLLRALVPPLVLMLLLLLAPARVRARAQDCVVCEQPSGHWKAASRRFSDFRVKFRLGAALAGSVRG